MERGISLLMGIVSHRAASTVDNMGSRVCERSRAPTISSPLGSSVRRHTGFGAVVRTSEPVAHKPLGAGSSVLSSKGFSAAAGTAACTDSHRQHVCGLVQKSPRRRTLQGSVQTGSESPAMGGLSLSLHQSSAHPRSPELRGGHAFEERDSSRRVEVAPPSRFG